MAALFEKKWLKGPWQVRAFRRKSAQRVAHSSWGLRGSVALFGLAVVFAGIALRPKVAHGQATSGVQIVPVSTVKGYLGGVPVYRAADGPGTRLGSKQGTWARHLTQVITEAAADLDLTVDLSNRTSLRPELLSTDALMEWAKSSWVVAPVLNEASRDALVVTLMVVPPGSNIVLQRSQRVSKDQLEVRTMVMLRDLVNFGRQKLGQPQASVSEGDRVELPRGRVAKPARSPGRAILSLTGAVIGGYSGFALQRASGSKDLRLTYPLAALGAGMGLASSMVIADEWDITTGFGWYLSGAALWPAVGSVLVADSYEASVDNRYMYGLIGSGAGLVLGATLASRGTVREGGALALHSFSAAGTVLGGIAEMTVSGQTDDTPVRGMGLGMLGGTLLGGVIGPAVEMSASRVLMLNVGAGLGGLGGAALLSPVLIVDREESEARNRLWLGGIAVGMVAGTLVAYATTSEPSRSSADQAGSGSWVPWVAPLGEGRGVLLGVNHAW